VQCAECRHIFTAPESGDTDYPRIVGDDATEAPERFRRPLRPARSELIISLGLGSVIAIGILSLNRALVPVPIGLGLLAWITGRADLHAIDSHQLDARGAWAVRAGMGLGACGMAASCLWLAATLVR
jgi:hypothetical protein